MRNTSSGSRHEVSLNSPAQNLFSPDAPAANLEKLGADERSSRSELNPRQLIQPHGKNKRYIPDELLSR